jgi:RimJ/RimL family protein N-acetyltransferase
MGGEAMSVVLRAIRESDLPDYVQWFNDPEVTQFTQLESGEITLEGEREWFRRVTSPENPDRNWAIEAEGRHIGNCRLHLEHEGRMGAFGIIIGDKTAWNRGYGTAATKEVLRIAFAEMKLHRVFLCTHGDNARAIRCYEKCGFRHEGRWIQARRKRGEWRDTVWMAVLRKEWEERANRCCSL